MNDRAVFVVLINKKFLSVCKKILNFALDDVRICRRCGLRSTLITNNDYIMEIMLLCLLAEHFLYHKPHILHTLTVLCACGNDIDSGGVDTAVTENVGKLCNIIFDAVKHTGKKVTKIVRKNIVHRKAYIEL